MKKIKQARQPLTLLSVWTCESTYLVSCWWQNFIQLLISEWSISLLQLLLPPIEDNNDLSYLRWQNWFPREIWQGLFLLKVSWNLLREARWSRACRCISSHSWRLWQFVRCWCRAFLVGEPGWGCSYSSTPRRSIYSKGLISGCRCLVPSIPARSFAHLSSSTSGGVPLGWWS